MDSRTNLLRSSLVRHVHDQHRAPTRRRHRRPRSDKHSHHKHGLGVRAVYNDEFGRHARRRASCQ